MRSKTTRLTSPPPAANHRLRNKRNEMSVQSRSANCADPVPEEGPLWVISRHEVEPHPDLCKKVPRPRYYGVIEKFGELTGKPVILDTSFNPQEPIVQRPEEAISCYLRTGIDVLVLGDFYTTDRKRNHLH